MTSTARYRICRVCEDGRCGSMWKLYLCFCRLRYSSLARNKDSCFLVTLMQPPKVETVSDGPAHVALTGLLMDKEERSWTIWQPPVLLVSSACETWDAAMRSHFDRFGTFSQSQHSHALLRMLRSSTELHVFFEGPWDLLGKGV